MGQLINLILILALIAGFYIAWNIGSNDAANAMGTSVGARVLSYRRATTLLILFLVLGALLEGYKVMKPVGEEIVVGPALSLLPGVVAVAMLCAGLWVTLATRLGFPVSTHHAIIGGLVGAGLAISMLTNITADVNWWKIFVIAVAWIVTPIGAALFAFAFYKIFGAALRKVKEPAKLDMIFALAVVISGCYVAYVTGANSVGTAMGAVYAAGKGQITGDLVQQLALLGAVGAAIGSLTYSRRVMETVGTGITQLGPMTAFVAQLGAALTVHLFTQGGFPVSTSQAIVGGVIGVGLIKGMATVGRGKISRIALMWVVTPTMAMIFTLILTSLLIPFWV